MDTLMHRPCRYTQIHRDTYSQKKEQLKRELKIKHKLKCMKSSREEFKREIG